MECKKTNYYILKYYLILNKYDNFKQIYHSISRRYRKESYEIDVGITKTSTYYYELNMELESCYDELKDIKKEFNFYYKNMLTLILSNKQLNSDVENYIQEFL